jgi:hypothetical protein
MYNLIARFELVLLIKTMTRNNRNDLYRCFNIILELLADKCLEFDKLHHGPNKNNSTAFI